MQDQTQINYQVMRAAADGRPMKSVWRLAAPPRSEKVLGVHPTQKPLPPLERVITASSDLGDLVLDPFVGSGTT